MTSDAAIEWISRNYSPSDFGIDERDLVEKLSQDYRYNYDEEIRLIDQKLLGDNPNFSNNLLNRISKETYKRLFISDDLGRIQNEAPVKRKFDNGESLNRREKDILLDVWGINADF